MAQAVSDEKDSPQEIWSMAPKDVDIFKNKVTYRTGSGFCLAPSLCIVAHTSGQSNVHTNQNHANGLDCLQKPGETQILLVSTGATIVR